MKNIQGIHHVSLNTTNNQQYEACVRFYRNLLGLEVKVEFANGIMLDTGSGIVEIFHNGKEDLPQGCIRHFAFDVADVDAMIERVRKEGFPIILEPKDVELGSMKARVAFCKGVIGEEIEFFQVK